MGNELEIQSLRCGNRVFNVGERIFDDFELLNWKILKIAQTIEPSVKSGTTPAFIILIVNGLNGEVKHWKTVASTNYEVEYKI